MATDHGKFITVEGIEGVGKTTNIAFIRNYLQARGVQVCVSREPGGTVIAEQIRQLLIAHHQEPLHEDAELLLVFAARAQHLHELIGPALAKGQWVVCDRFTDATFAYQGAGRGLSTARIEQLQQWVQGPLRPDLTLVLDLPVALGMSRVSRRGAADRFEREQHSFFERVRGAYLERARQEPERVRVVDAAGDLPAVQAAIAEILAQRFGL